MWYRIFGTADAEPRPDDLLAHLNRVAPVRGHFRGDAAGWFHADLVTGAVTLSLDRYTADEEGVRAEFNAWAARVESCAAPEPTALMERLIQTRQLFALQVPDGEYDGTAALCIALCTYLATHTDGVYHEEERGFFSATGTPLLACP